MNLKETTPYWNDKANMLLLGKRIVKVYYLSTKEAHDYEWYKRPVSFVLDDGTRIIPQMDDEGNDGGALWVGNKDSQEVLPVLSREDN